MNFYSNGKLLLTGEYLVLKGALALAVPLRFGQGMLVEALPQGRILDFKSYTGDRLWFESRFSLPLLEILQTNDAKRARYIRNLLVEANAMNPLVLNRRGSLAVTNRLDFEPEWGLGSSSSLVSNIAYWFGIDPFQLHFRCSHGSGYDIACARADKTLFYRLQNGNPQVKPIDFNPEFSADLYFVYLGQKADSAKSIHNHQELLKNKSKEINKISSISLELSRVKTLEAFRKLIDEHEEIMARILNRPMLSEQLFRGFPGSVKSLGAWGGDFAMVTWQGSREALHDWLMPMNLNTVFSFDEMILKNSAVLKK